MLSGTFIEETENQLVYNYRRFVLEDGSEIGGPFWVRRYDILNRIKQHTTYVYLNMTERVGYRPTPLFTITGIQRLDVGSRNRLRRSVTRGDNALAWALRQFLEDVAKEGVVDEYQLLRALFRCPPDIRVLWDAKGPGVVEFLRRKLSRMGVEIREDLEGWDLFVPATPTFDVSTPLVEDFHLVYLSGQLLKEHFFTTHAKVFVIDFDGQKLVSAEQMLKESFFAPLHGDVSLRHPLYAHLFGILRVDVLQLVRAITWGPPISRPMVSGSPRSALDFFVEIRRIVCMEPKELLGRRCSRRLVDLERKGEIRYFLSEIIDSLVGPFFEEEIHTQDECPVLVGRVLCYFDDVIFTFGDAGEEDVDEGESDEEDIDGEDADEENGGVADGGSADEEDVEEDADEEF